MVYCFSRTQFELDMLQKGALFSFVYTTFVHSAVFLTSLYDVPLVQRAFYLALHSSLFFFLLQLIMIIMYVTNSIHSLSIGYSQ